MADEAQEAQGQEAEALTTDEFTNLLQKEFKPKSDRAKEAVETAVQTLAETVMQEAVTISDDVIATVQSIIAEIDKKSFGADQPGHAPRGLSEAGRAPGADCTIWSTTPRPTRCSRYGS